MSGTGKKGESQKTCSETNIDVLLQDLAKRVNALETEELNGSSKETEQFEELIQAHEKLQQDYQWLLEENSKLRLYAKVLERDHKLLQQKYISLEQDNQDLLETHAQRKGQLGTLQKRKDQQHAAIVQLKTTNSELQNRNRELFMENEGLRKDIEKYRKTRGVLGWWRRICGVH